MDVALLKLPVTFVLDRARITGPDGPSHNGVWDLSLLGIVPGMRVAAPRDASSLQEQLGEALMIADGPTAIRFPKGAIGWTSKRPTYRRCGRAIRPRGPGCPTGRGRPVCRDRARGRGNTCRARSEQWQSSIHGGCCRYRMS